MGVMVNSADVFDVDLLTLTLAFLKLLIFVFASQIKIILLKHLQQILVYYHVHTSQVGFIEDSTQDFHI